MTDEPNTERRRPEPLVQEKLVAFFDENREELRSYFDRVADASPEATPEGGGR